MSISRREFVVSAASLAATAVATHADQTTPRQATASSDPLGVRADFPITQTRTYLNSAYITPVPSQVVAAGRAFVESKSIKPISLGEMLRRTDQVRTQFAQLIHAEADEVGFLFATSEGENVVANALDLKAGDNVVVDDLHYETEFVLYQHLRESKGIEFRVVKHRDGRVDGKDFEALVDRRTRLVSVAWVSHHNGFRHDMRPLADLAHSVGAIFYVDGIQALGMIATDVRAAGVDVMCAGTYKWMLGGFGVAPFYVRRDLLDRIRLDRFGALHVERTLADGGFQLYRTAKRFDYATLPFCEVYQLGAGLDYVARVGVERIEQHTVTLAQSLRAGLAAQGYKLFTPEGNRSSIVTYLTAKEAGTLTAAFDRAAIDVTVRAATGQVRVSPALFNTHDDIAKFLEITKSLA